MSGCQLVGERHYGVTSGEVCWSPAVYAGDQPEPGEWGYCWVLVAAKNRRAARVAAIRMKDMESWVTLRRGDNQPPMGGLDVEELVCDHGVCWGCEDECADCFREQIEADEAQAAIEACTSCNELGLVWDPRVDGNVVPCHHNHHGSREARA